MTIEEIPTRGYRSSGTKSLSKKVTKTCTIDGAKVPSDVQHDLSNGHAPRHDARPKIIEIRNLADFTHHKTSSVDVNQPLFQPVPSEILFSNFEPFEAYTQQLRLRNNDHVPRSIWIESPASSVFRISPVRQGKDGAVKVAAGMEVTCEVTFLPEEKKDYEIELHCITEREKFVIPIRAIGTQACLDFPDEVVFPVCPPRYQSEQVLLVTNVGTRPVRFTIRTPPDLPFSFSPSSVSVAVNEPVQLVATFNPPKAGVYEGTVLLDYDIYKGLEVKVRGEACDVDVSLSQPEVKLQSCYITLESQAVLKIQNRSDIQINFAWKRSPSEEDDSRVKLERTLELSHSEGLERKEQFGEDDLHGFDEDDPMLVERWTQTNVMKSRYLRKALEVEADEMLFADEIFSIEPPTGLIQPGCTMEVRVTFCPQIAGPQERTAYLSVSGRGDRLPLRMIGEGLGPALALSYDVLDVQHIFTCSLHQYELEIENRGEIDAEFELVPSSTMFGQMFRFEPSRGVLPHGELVTVDVTLESSTLGKFNETFHWHVNGAMNDLAVRYKGEVVGPTFHFDVEEVNFQEVSFGFPHVRTIVIYNTSEIPMTYVLRVPDDTNGEFEVIPASGTVLPEGKKEIRVEFVSRTANKAYDTALTVDIEGVGRDVKRVPLRALCVVPPVTCSLETLEFQECFLRFPYTKSIILKNESKKLPARFDVLPQDDASTCLAKYILDPPSAELKPLSEMELKVKLQTERLGVIKLPLHIHVQGLAENRPLVVNLLATAVGPCVRFNPEILNWGNTPVLQPVENKLSLHNDSHIPAEVRVYVKGGAKSVFQTKTKYLHLEPGAIGTVVVTAELDDTIPFSDELHVIVTEGVDQIVPLRALGVGCTLFCQEPLSKVHLGPQFTNQVCTRDVVIENRGRRPVSVSWYNQTAQKRQSLLRSIRMKGKAAEAAVRSAKQQNIPLDDDWEESFCMQPDKFLMQPKSSYTFQITGLCKRVGEVTEGLLCRASTIGDKGAAAKSVFEPEITADFSDPLLEFSYRTVSFVYQWEMDKPAKIQTQPLTLRNVSPLPLTFTLKANSPFSVDPMTRMRLEPEESVVVQVSFNTACKSDKLSRIMKRHLTVHYADHPQKDHVDLVGELIYPNLAFEKTEVDFGCVLNDTVRYVNVPVKNCSKVAVHYRWAFLENVDAYRSKPGQPSIPPLKINEVFDIRPIESHLEPGETENVEFEYYGHAFRKFKATAVCEVTGGPEYEVNLFGDASAVQYRLDDELEETMTIDFGLCVHDQTVTRDFLLYNIGKVGFNFTVDTRTLTRDNVVMVSPPRGTVNPNDKAKFTVRFCPGIPDKIEEVFLLLVAHFEPIRITVSGAGIYPQLLVSLPRTITDEYRVHLDHVHSENASQMLLASPGRSTTDEYRMSRQASTAAGVPAAHTAATAGGPNNTDANTNTSPEVVTADATGPVVEVEPGSTKISPRDAPPAEPVLSARANSTIMPGTTTQSVVGFDPAVTGGMGMSESGIRRRRGSLASTITSMKMDVRRQMFELEAERLLLRSRIESAWQGHVSDDTYLTRFVCDFGNVIKGLHKNKRFRIVNVGHLPISFDLDKRLYTYAGFSLEPEKIVKLAGAPDNGQMDIQCTFHSHRRPLGPVEIVVPVAIKNGPASAIVLKANVTVPDVLLSSDILDFGKVLCGHCRIMTLQLHNHKEVNAEWSIKKPLDSPKDVIYFQCEPMSGVLPPGEKCNVMIRYTPAIERKSSLKFTVKVANNPKSQHYSVRGIGIESKVILNPTYVDVGVIQPNAESVSKEFLLSNPSDCAIEVYSVDFDAQYLKEEEMLRACPQFFDEDNLYLTEPQELGSGLPAELVRQYEMMHRPADEGDNDAAPPAPISQVDDSVNLVVAGPPMVGKTTQAVRLASRYTVPLLTLDNVLTMVCETESDTAAAVKKVMEKDAKTPPSAQQKKRPPAAKQGATASLDVPTLTRALKEVLQRPEFASGVVLDGLHLRYTPPAQCAEAVRQVFFEMGRRFRVLHLTGGEFLDNRLDEAIKALSERPSQAATGEAPAKPDPNSAPAEPSPEALKMIEELNNKMEAYRESVDPMTEVFKTLPDGFEDPAMVQPAAPKDDTTETIVVAPEEAVADDKRKMLCLPFSGEGDEDTVYDALVTVLPKLPSELVPDPTMLPIPAPVTRRVYTMPHPRPDRRPVRNFTLTTIKPAWELPAPDADESAGAAETAAPPEKAPEEKDEKKEKEKKKGRRSSITEPPPPPPEEPVDPTDDRTRWIIPPKGSVRLVVTFACDRVGTMEESLTFEVCGRGRQYTMLCRGRCDLPRISDNVGNVFFRRKKLRNPTSVATQAYVVNRDRFEFGALLVKPDTNGAELNDLPPEYKSQFRITNSGEFPCSVNFSLLDSMTDQQGGPVFAVSPWEMDLGIDETKELTVYGVPRVNGEFENTLVCNVKDNPVPVTFKMFCLGTRPAVKLDCETIEFERLLLYRTESKTATLTNTSACPIKWRVDLPEEFGQEFTISPPNGKLDVGQSSLLTVDFNALQAGVYDETIHIIASDKQDLLGDAEKLPLQLQAEAYNIELDVQFPAAPGEVGKKPDTAKKTDPAVTPRGKKGAKKEEEPPPVDDKRGLDFGLVKVVSPSTLTYTMKNKGKYDVGFKFQIKKKVIRDMFTISPPEGILTPAENPRTIEVTFKADQEVHLIDNTDIKCLISETLTNEVTASLPVRVGVRSVFSKYKVLPIRGINFGPVVYGTTKTRTIDLTNKGEFDFTFSISRFGEDPGQDGAQAGGPPSSAAKKAPAGGQVVLGPFTISPATGTLAPGQQQAFQVTFNAGETAMSVREVIGIHITDRDASETPHGMEYQLSGQVCIPGINASDYESIFEEQTVVHRHEVTPPDLLSGFVEAERVFNFGAIHTGQVVQQKFCLTNASKVVSNVSCELRPRGAASDGDKKKEASLPDDFAFSVEPKKIAIPPLDRRYVTVTFRPPTMANFHAIFEATTEKGIDPKTKQLTFDVKGSGTLPAVTVLEPVARNKNGHPLLQFGKHRVGRSESMSILLRNYGVLSAKVLLQMSAHSLFEVERGPFIIEPGQSRTVMASFYAKRVEQATHLLHMAVEDNPFEDTVFELAGEAFQDDVTIAGLPDETEEEIRFGDCTIGEENALSFTLNNSGSTHKRFTFEAPELFRFIPSVGHLHARSAKDVIVTYSPSQASVVEDALMKLTVETLKYESGEVADWDDRMKSVRWEDEEGRQVPNEVVDELIATEGIEEISTPAAPQSRGSNRGDKKGKKDKGADKADTPADDNPTGKRRFRKLVDVDPEPAHEIVPESSVVKELKATAVADYVRYECDVQQVNFKTTFMFQSRTFTFPLKNVSKANLRYSCRLESENGEADEGFFTVSPETGTLPGETSGDISVTFAPLEVDTQCRYLVVDIINLHSEEKPLRIPVRGRSGRPLCHFELPDSDYLTAGRRPLDMRDPAGRLGPLDPMTRVIEVESLGTNVRNTKRFYVVNPTNMSYEFEWTCEDTRENNPDGGVVRCRTKKGLVLAGKKYEMVFEFVPNQMATIESFWRFKIKDQHPPLDVPFVCVGTVAEPKVAFDRPHLNFQSVLLGRKGTEEIQLINSEHIPFSFHFDKSTFRAEDRPAVEIVPSSGVVGPSKSLPIEVRFNPQEERVFNYNVQCVVRNKQQPLMLNIKGEGYSIHDKINFSGDRRRVEELSASNVASFGTLNFKASVRETEVQTITLTNRTETTWRIVPTVSHEAWVAPDYVEVHAGKQATVDVTYAPLLMTNPESNEKHTGAIVFPLPGSSAIIYNLVGTADPPSPAGTVTCEVPAKTAHSELLRVTNWLKKKQTFIVHIEPEEKSPATILEGASSIDVPGGATLQYELRFYAYKEGVTNGQVKFVNPETGEYVLYKMQLTATPAQALDTIELHTPVRQSVQHDLSVKNPLDAEITLAVACDASDLTFPESVVVAPKSSKTVPLSFRPLLVYDKTSKMTLQCPELGQFLYNLKLQATSSMEKGMSFSAPLGLNQLKTFRFLHYSRKATEFKCSAKGDFSVPNGDLHKVQPADPNGSELAVDIMYEPSSLEESQATLTISSSEGGEYVVPLHGQPIAPQPQGPFTVKAGGSAGINFKNVFDKQLQYDFVIEPVGGAFSIAKQGENIGPGKAVKIDVAYKPSDEAKGAGVANGKLVVSTEGVSPWIFYLRGVSS